MPSTHPLSRSDPWLRRWVFPVAALLVCLLVIGVNLDKTLWTGIQGWGRPYWWLDYRHGFIRRGLVGEIYQRVAGRRTEAGLIESVDLIHRLCLGALAIATLYALLRALREQTTWARSAVVAAAGLWLAASEFWPTVAYNQGYMDALVLVVAVGASFLMRARIYWAAGLLLFVGPFIHEYFIFLVPFVLASERLRPEPTDDHPGDGLVGYHEHETPKSELRHIYALAAVATLAAALVTVLPSRSAAALEIAAMPMSAQDRGVLFDTTLTQTFSTSLQECLNLMVSHLGFTFKGAVFFLAPALVSVAAMLLWRGRPIRRMVWIRAGAALFPTAALALAWDFSRLMVMADFTAGMLFLMTARDLAPPLKAEQPPARPMSAAVAAATAALGLAALGYAALPMAYVYYPPGPATLFPLKTWPGEGRRVFGLSRLWPYATVSKVLPHSLPSDQKHLGPQLFGDMRTGADVTKAGGGRLRVPAANARLILFGPYIDLQPGRYRVTMQLRQTATAGVCPALPAIEMAANADVGRTLVAQKEAVAVGATGGCRSQAVMAFTVGKPAKEVETPVFAASAQPFFIEGYRLERTGDAAQSR